MNRGALVLTLFLAGFAAACSGGSTPTPPPPTGGFSNADLKGQYAFIMSGTDSATFSFLARVGSFTADGNGNITGGVEDVSSVANGAATLAFTNSTYSIQADGRGTINLTNSTGTLTFSVTMISPSQGFIVETDLNATASGTFNLQNANDFSLASLSGSYVFDTSGIDPSGSPDSIVGQFATNGSGAGVTSGVVDENDNAKASGPLVVTNGIYSLDSTYGATNGRGSISITAGGITYSYFFYIVDNTRIRMLEVGSTTTGITVGDAVLQSNPPTANSGFTGSFVYLQGGSSNSGPITRLGRFTADGNGGLGSISLNTNDSGTAKRVPQGTVSAMTYAIDPNFPGSGRGTATFTDSQLGTYSYIFYMISPTQGVIQDISPNIVADGTILAQSGGPFTTTSLAGNYGFNLSGVSSNSSTGVTAEEDYVGQLALSAGSSNNVSGASDFSEFSSNNGVFLNIVVNGAGLSIQGDGTTATGNSNTLQLKFNTTPTSTLNFAAYIVNTNTMFVAGIDNNRVISGTLTQQTK
jgi:hypothetical protein